MKLKSTVLWIALILLAGLNQASACSVCFQSGGEERWAFYFTTAFLTFLPLSFLGGFIFWLKRRFKRLEEEGVS